jgi:hypothetical protein
LVIGDAVDRFVNPVGGGDWVRLDFFQGLKLGGLSGEK